MKSQIDHFSLQDIHKKILSLNFRDCHAKIRQVDSQATVGNAVVVQVGIHCDSIYNKWALVYSVVVVQVCIHDNLYNIHNN